LIQTAEGALNETHSILQRMRELAVQAASDTNTDSDRAELQKEINELITEIDRIANTTEFNTKNLLDGSFAGTFQIGANEGQVLELSIGSMGSANLGLAAGLEVQKGVAASGGTGLKAGIYTVSGTSLVDANGQVVGRIASNEVTLADTNKYTFGKTSALNDGDIITVGEDGKATLVKNLKAGQTNTLLAPGTYTIDTDSNVFKDNMKIGTFASNVITFEDGTTTFDLGAAFGANLAAKDTFVVKGIDVSNRTQAAGSITAIDKALEQVSAERSKLGAYQNRLEHTINNLGTSSENLSAAESRIRDVDMAKEMMEFTKNNILTQAAQAMLAQANQLPQGVLQLLR